MSIIFRDICNFKGRFFQVSEKLLEAKQLEFYTWEGESEELLRGVREKLNMLGEVGQRFFFESTGLELIFVMLTLHFIIYLCLLQHWSRDEKNKCLREATKSFRFLGQIVRLIIL